MNLYVSLLMMIRDLAEKIMRRTEARINNCLIGKRGRYCLAGDNRGMGTVEVILIIVVLVGLVIIFKTQITSIVNSLFEKITAQTSRV